MVSGGSKFTIGDRIIDASSPCYFIAEAGVNHNGQIDLALQLVDAAKEAGADAVKFQAFDPDLLVATDAPQAEYQASNLGFKQTQHEMLVGLALSRDQFQQIAAYCAQRKIAFLCTPFDDSSADLVVELGCPAVKVGSGDLTNFLLLRKLARFGLPLIISTGMADMDEVRAAINTVVAADVSDLLLLHCVSDYPAAPELMNLRAMKTMEDALGFPVGLSDHTMGYEVTLAAVALGARLVEKHLTLDRSMVGPDHAASLEPYEFKEMIAGARNIEKAMGTGVKSPSYQESAVATVARRSLAASQSIPAGTIIEEKHLTALRPATGIPADQWALLIGKRVSRDVKKHEFFDHATLG